MKKIVFAVLAMVSLICGFSGMALADDFNKHLSTAFINIPPDASNAGMGNAWAATPNFGSNNPAVTAMGDCENGGVSFNYGVIDFGKGPDIQFYSPSAAMRLPVGVLQMSYSVGDSDKGTYAQLFTSHGGYMNDIEFNSINGMDFQYGLNAAEKIFFPEDKLYVGVGYNYGKSDISFGSQVGTPATGWTSSLDSQSKSHTWSVGMVYQPTADVSIGGSCAHSWDKTKETLASGGWAEEETSQTQATQYRLGVGVQVSPLTFIAVDYQRLDLPDGNVNQIFAGIEQGIIKDFLYLYGGWAGDGPTVGVGMYFKNGGMNLAYMHDTNDGLSDTLGKTRTTMLSIYGTF